MNRRHVLSALSACAMAAAPFARAQQQMPKVPHIAYLSQGSVANRGALLTAFKDALRELGWTDGRNIVVDVHWAPPAEFSQIAASLVRARKADLFVGTCVPSTRAAKNASSTIPVIMSINGDPVEAGLVASLAHPGANVTGTSTLFEQLVPKWLELIMMAAPQAQTIAVIANPESIGDEYWWTQMQEAAKRLRVKVVRSEANTAASLESTFEGMKKQRAGAFIMMVDAFFLNEIQRIVTLASVYKLPGIYGFREYAEAGGLMSYGLSYRDYYKGVARYVDRVLKGARPANLPVEQPTKIEFVINRVTARALNLALPDALLARADKVIS